MNNFYSLEVIKGQNVTQEQEGVTIQSFLAVSFIFFYFFFIFDIFVIGR